MSVIAALGPTRPGLTLGAALSKSPGDLPCPSFPVTTRRMGRSFSVMWFYSIQLQARLLHDRGVPVVLSFEELGIFLRRVARRVQAERNEAAPDVRDRKSTRLNSSHLVISYAVFCLKKKKINSKSIIMNTTL